MTRRLDVEPPAGGLDVGMGSSLARAFVGISCALGFGDTEIIEFW